MKNSEIHSAASVKEDGARKDDFSEDFSECSRRPILGHAWLFCALSSYSPFSALAILCILPRISSSLLFSSTSKLNSKGISLLT